MYEFSQEDVTHIETILSEDWRAGPRAAFREYHHLDPSTPVQIEDVEEFIWAYKSVVNNRRVT